MGCNCKSKNIIERNDDNSINNSETYENIKYKLIFVSISIICFPLIVITFFYVIIEMLIRKKDTETILKPLFGKLEKLKDMLDSEYDGDEEDYDSVEKYNSEDLIMVDVDRYEK